jgi:phytoene synthase
MTSRSELVAFARDSIARGSKSFAAASTLFDPATRERAWLLYAWCRAADDLADGQEMGHGTQAVADPLQRLATIRTLTDAALAGAATGNPAFDALGVVARECRIPARYVHDVVDGFALDAAGFRPQVEADLYRYCYHVAGAVGCMMAIVMGVEPGDDAVLDRACDLGIAFQLANIARDLAEDDAAGRCYVPAAWAGEPRARIAARLADRAEAHEASARFGARALSFRSAWAVLAAAGIYGDIAREVKRRGDAAWDQRVMTSKAAKLGWIARAFIASARRSGIADPGRDGLYRRP